MQASDLCFQVRMWNLYHVQVTLFGRKLSLHFYTPPVQRVKETINGVNCRQNEQTKIQIHHLFFNSLLFCSKSLAEEKQCPLKGVCGERWPCVTGWVGERDDFAAQFHEVTEFFFYALQTASKPSARKAETSVWVWGRLPLPFSRPWGCLCLQVPVAASLEGHEKAAPAAWLSPGPGHCHSKQSLPPA